MRNALKRIQTGEYAKMFISEGRLNYPSMTARRRQNADHAIEQVGGQLRSMMPWISKNKLVDQTRTDAGKSFGASRMTVQARGHLRGGLFSFRMRSVWRVHWWQGHGR
jgi:hypothetical protein